MCTGMRRVVKAASVGNPGICDYPANIAPVRIAPGYLVDPHYCMNDPKSPSQRPTLKLKGGARRPTTASAAPTHPQPHPPTKLKPGAHWSDEYKERMQAEMDALSRPPTPSQRP